MLALLALSSFDAVQPLPGAARELASTLASGRRILGLTQREPAVVDPDRPESLSGDRPLVALEGVSARYPGGRSCSKTDLRLSRARAPRWSDRAGRGRPR
jgi:hypothetical protein